MTDEVQFKPGDVVQLKSGGPPMTVGDVKREKDPQEGGFAPAVWCDWMDANGHAHGEWFKPVTIKPY